MEHNDSQNISSVIRKNSSCPQKTLPDPTRYPAWYKSSHRASQVAYPIPDAPRCVSAVNIQNVCKTILTFSPYRIIIWKKAMQSKMTPLIKQYCRSIAGEHVQEDCLDRGTFRSSDMGQQLFQQQRSYSISPIRTSYS